MPATPRPREVTPCPLSELAALLALPDPSSPVTVSGITHDSRQVRPGDLFVALPGASTHGVRFADQAIAAGAAAVFTDEDGAHELAGRLPVLVAPGPRSSVGELSARIYGYPARDLLMLGVTGTNGKTTTTFLAEAGLRAAGHRTGLIGTVETRIGDERVASVRTTPEATDVHALLAVMRERGATACVMEVSSHALVFGRVDGIVYDVAGFTNLSQDHLDFHPDMDDYFAAKAQLFTPRRARRGVVCVDDRYGRRMAATSGIPVITLATSDPGPEPADWQVADREVSSSGATTVATVRGPGGSSISVTAPLPGDFNVANAALAVVMLLEAGVPADEAISGVAACEGLPGRMERVTVAAADEPLAVVDYAHTPAAIETVLRALRPATTGRLVVVVGAGGDRDATKRPLMGAAAARQADVVIVTDDNPRSEPPESIRASVRAGATEPETRRERGADVREVPDRAEAIRLAVDLTDGSADTVAVLGKGHEQGQEVAGVVHPFDDRAVLYEALAARGKVSR